jgi:hypothetical protein
MGHKQTHAVQRKTDPRGQLYISFANRIDSDMRES